MNFARGAAALAAGLALVTSVPADAMAAERVTLTGTYRLMAKEVDEGHSVRHAYEDRLVARGRSYRLRLTASQRPTPGATVTVSAMTDRATGDVTSVTSVRTMSEPERPPLGPTRTLAILAYWSSPDSVTQARASSQLFGDDSTWLREVSYGQSSLSGSVTPWVRIPAPRTGLCYADGDTIMANARSAAFKLGYDYRTFHRTLVYFPRCSGGDTTNLTGWAYEPGEEIWLNGVMDRRTSVHEHGHSFGLTHARAYWCETSTGARVTLGGSQCHANEYGDPYDAMGQSGYVAHFNAPHKDVVGWLGSRKRVMTTSSGSYTLAPLEKTSTNPLAVVANSPVLGRRYWVEYRQPVGYDARLPAGATAGVLIHMEDTSVGGGPYLLDPTPSDASLATAVLGAGRSWTAPDGVRIAVGTVSSTGATVTITGARPEPVPPGPARSVVATPGDTRVAISWQPPLSSGNGTISRYVVSTSGGISRTVGADVRATTFEHLANDRYYSFTVRATTEAGDGPPVTASATPRVSPPTIEITSPAPDSVIAGTVTMLATARPGATSLGEVQSVRWSVGTEYGVWLQPDEPFTWNTMSVQNGTHVVTATVTDDNARSTSTRAAYQVRNPRPAATITSPSPDASVTGGVVTVDVAATAADDGVEVARVDLLDHWGNLVGSDTTAPYQVAWNVTNAQDGQHRLTARATDTQGRHGLSPVVSVNVWHPPPTIAALTPATGTTVRGTTVTVSAEVATGTPGVPIRYVQFTGPTGSPVYDYSAPYTATFDTSALKGETTFVAFAYDSGGRQSDQRTTVTLDNPLPSVTVTSPTTVVRTQKATLSGTATPAAAGATIRRVTVQQWWSPYPTDATLAADGTWTIQWSYGHSYGTHSLVVTAIDSAGYRTTRPLSFVTERPRPTVTIVSPAAGGAVTTKGFDVVMRVEPAADAYATVNSVCVHDSSRYYAVACGAKQADGTYRAVIQNGMVPPGSHWLSVQVDESDGYGARYLSQAVDVYAPPTTPDLQAEPNPDATVMLYWPRSSDSFRPVDEYVVRDAAGTVVATTPGGTTWTTVPATPAGVQTSYTVEGRNAYGVSNRSAPAYVTPMWETWVQGVSVSPSTTTFPATTTIRARAVRGDGAPMAGRRLRVELMPVNYAGPPAVTWTGPTSADGWVSAAVSPSFTANVHVSLVDVYGHRDSISDAVRVTVKARVEGNLTIARIPLGRSTAFNGGVRAPMPGRGVALQRYYGSGVWRTVALRNQDSTGRVSFALKPAARGTYVYRLAYGGDVYRTGNVSATRTLTVY